VTTVDSRQWQPRGARMHATAHRAQIAQQAARHQVTAVVLEPAPSAQMGGWGAADAWVPARWTAPDGKVMTDKVLEPAGTAAGAKVPVWVTRGRATGPRWTARR
jgi:hypothetical protein